MTQEINNIIFDTNYTSNITKGWYPSIDRSLFSTQKQVEKKWFFENLAWLILWDKPKTQENTPNKNDSTQSPRANKKLEEQIRHLININDDEYSDKLLTPELRRYIMDIEKDYLSTLSDYKTHISPSFREVKPGYFSLSGLFWKTYYAQSYPSYIDLLWTRDIVNFYWKWDMSFFIYPADDTWIKWMLKRRATQLKAEISDAAQRWVTIDTEVEIEYRDVDMIRNKLATREERYFESSFYFTLYEDNLDKLQENWRKFEQKIAWSWIRIKSAIQRMDEWLNSTLPLWLDELGISRSAVTTSLAWSFPFISNDLIDNRWILYWINLHTWSLVIFDRFSKKLPNANSVILATSWAWKSFTMKLEILRYLIYWIDILVIDPENEYKSLIEKVWWTYINIAVNSNQHLNPFDLPSKIEDIEYWPWDLLRSQIMNLVWLISVLIWWVTPEEEAILDKAIQNTYALKEITFDDSDPGRKQPPIMENLLQVLEGTEWGDKLAIRLSKYVTWTFWKLFNNHTNVDLNNWLTIFSIRDIEDALKTPAMFNILNFIWNKVRAHKKKRLVIVDEAWIMLQHEISANFLLSLSKRARKYWVWLTTITQDIEDFIRSPYGKPIISNCSMQVLLKQSPASIKALDQVFWLSEAEKQKLVAANVWEGLFFAWNQHVAIKILASPTEKDFISTDVK